jgi:KDO2-lipid IV(A) lauroyltransferase
LLEACRRVIQALSHKQALALGRLMGRLAWLIGFRARRLAERQLCESGVAANPKTARRDTLRVFENLGMNVVEWMHSLTWSPEDFRRKVQVEGGEITQLAWDNWRGIVFVSAHLGNWELLTGACQAYFAMPIAAVMAEQRNQALNDWIVRQRETQGAKLLSTKSAVLGMMRHLRRGGTLGLIADQDSTRGRGIFVDFFGRPAYTPAGPAHLAHRTGIPILLATITRRPEDPRFHVMHFDNLIQPNPKADEEADILRMTQAFTTLLEERIRANPTQWVWVHNRWNHRPGQKIRIRSAGRKQKTVPSVSASAGNS